MSKQTFTPLQYWSYYERENLPKYLVDTLIEHPCTTFEVPTENVLLPGDKLARMNVGRVWYAAAEFGRDSGSDADGSGHWESCRHIIEVMENGGDDGHTEYECIGWALVTSTMMSDYLRAVNECRMVYAFPYFNTTTYDI